MTGGLYQGRRNPLDSHHPTAPPAEELRYGGGALSRPTACRFFIFAKRCGNALRGQGRFRISGRAARWRRGLGQMENSNSATESSQIVTNSRSLERLGPNE